MSVVFSIYTKKMQNIIFLFTTVYVLSAHDSVHARSDSICFCIYRALNVWETSAIEKEPMALICAVARCKVCKLQICAAVLTVAFVYIKT